MEAFEYRKEALVVLELRGRVDEFNTAVLAAELNTILNTGRFFIAINLKETLFLSAHCMHAIWKCHKRAQGYRGAIMLVGCVGDVQKSLEEIGFSRVVPILHSEEEAIALIANCKNRILTQSESEANPDKNMNTNIWSTLRVKMSRWIGLSLLGACSLWKFSHSEPSLAAPTIQKPIESGKDTYTLKEVLDLARTSSPAVRLARLRMTEKEADIGVARSAGLPRIIGTAGYVYQSDPSVLVDAMNREMNNVRNQSDADTLEQTKTRTKVSVDKDVAVIGLGFGQVVYSGGLFTSQIALRESQRKEVNAAAEVEALKLDDQVRDLYLAVVLSREKIRLYKAHREAIKQRLDAAKQALALRSISETQYSELEILHIKALRDELDAEREEKGARGLLNIALGRSTNRPLIPIEIEFKEHFEIESAEYYFDIAVHKSAELRRSMALIDSATAFSSMTNAQSVFSPTAVVFGSAQYTHGLGVQLTNVSWALGAGVMIPLYDGRKSHAEFAKATALSGQARLGYEQNEVKLKMEIEDLVNKLQQVRLQKELAVRTLEVVSRKRQETERAITNAQMPQYKLAEILAQECEAQMYVVAARAELYKSYIKLSTLIGREEIKP